MLEDKAHKVTFDIAAVGSADHADKCRIEDGVRNGNSSDYVGFASRSGVT